MIHLSKSALREINRMKTKQANLSVMLRLGVKEGGCAGFYYTMQLDEAVGEDDTIWECNGLKIVIDPQSILYINNLSVDYSEDLMGGGFRFQNPNTAQSCSCGHSFAV